MMVRGEAVEGGEETGEAVLGPFGGELVGERIAGTGGGWVEIVGDLRGEEEEISFAGRETAEEGEEEDVRWITVAQKRARFASRRPCEIDMAESGRGGSRGPQDRRVEGKLGLERGL